MTAKEIWGYDKKRCDFLIKNNKILIIWEKDVYNDREKEIHKCINFIKGI
jgi:hypothetical protein